jgi:hypothetical protein
MLRIVKGSSFSIHLKHDNDASHDLMALEWLFALMVVGPKINGCGPCEPSSGKRSPVSWLCNQHVEDGRMWQRKRNYMRGPPF